MEEQSRGRTLGVAASWQPEASSSGLRTTGSLERGEGQAWGQEAWESREQLREWGFGGWQGDGGKDGDDELQLQWRRRRAPAPLFPFFIFPIPPPYPSVLLPLAPIFPARALLPARAPARALPPRENQSTLPLARLRAASLASAPLPRRLSAAFSRLGATAA